MFEIGPCMYNDKLADTSRRLRRLLRIIIQGPNGKEAAQSQPGNYLAGRKFALVFPALSDERRGEENARWTTSN